MTTNISRMNSMTCAYHTYYGQYRKISMAIYQQVNIAILRFVTILKYVTNVKKERQINFEN